MYAIYLFTYVLTHKIDTEADLDFFFLKMQFWPVSEVHRAKCDQLDI